MQDLWLPEQNPPKVSEEARFKVAERLRTKGVNEVVTDGSRKLGAYHEPLLAYISKFGDGLNKLSPDGPWPKEALKVGAALAVVAYTESGFFQTVDEEALQVGSFSASLTGIPDAFLTSVNFDHELGELIYETLEQPGNRYDLGGIRQVMTIGGGCVRHFMQQAIAA